MTILALSLGRDARPQGSPETTSPETTSPDAFTLATKLLRPAHADRCQLSQAKPERASRQEPDQRVTLHDPRHETPLPLPSGPWTLLQAPSSASASGFVRAQIEVKGALRMTLVLRAQAPSLAASSTPASPDAPAPAPDAPAPDAPAPAPSGYGLVFAGDSAQLVRLDQGVAHPLTPARPIFKLAARRRVEALVWMMGQDLLVQLHDGLSGVELLHLHARDARYSGPGLGLLVDPANPQGSALTLWSARPLCGPGPSPNPKLARPPRHFITLPLQAALPRALAPLTRELERDALHKVIEADALTSERLACDPQLGPSGQISIEIPWKYLDEDYLAYRRSPPILDRGRLRTDLSYKNPQMVEQLLRALHARHPKHTRLETLGHSRQGRPILALALAHDLQESDPRPAILLNAAHHGNEPISTEIAFDALDHLLQSAAHTPEVKGWLREVVLWVVPQVNPDGAHTFLERSWRAGRKNGRDLDQDGQHDLDEGVDLNRNYPFAWGTLPKGSSPDPTHHHFRGDSPGSEPETQAIMRLVARERFLASLSYHTGTVCLLAPYTIDGVADPTPNEAWAVAEQLAQAMPLHPEGRLFRVRRNLYPVDGTDQDWMRHTHGTVAILVEATRQTPKQTCLRRAVTRANSPSWAELLRRVVAGPTLHGHVVDEQGRPVQAQITLKGQTLRAGERWLSRPRDGEFSRFIQTPGRLTLSVSAPGYEPLERTIPIKARGITRATLTLRARPTLEAPKAP